MSEQCEKANKLLGFVCRASRYIQSTQTRRTLHRLTVVCETKWSETKKLTVKPNVPHGVKADRLSSVRWKDILDVHCTDRVTVAAYRCIEDNFTVNCKRCLISPSLFEASAVCFPSLHRLHLQCNCSILSLPLYMFVVAVLTRLPSLC